mmetsp:Transcript_48696/g.103548  ORF Transcript_48696/g.103548 Transcript_48696/m.103548 type:complete len:228 (-) Transcript_48696:210-893(-)
MVEISQDGRFMDNVFRPDRKLVVVVPELGTQALHGKVDMASTALADDVKNVAEVPFSEMSHDREVRPVNLRDGIKFRPAQHGGLSVEALFEILVCILSDFQGEEIFWRGSGAASLGARRRVRVLTIIFRVHEAVGVARVVQQRGHGQELRVWPVREVLVSHRPRGALIADALGLTLVDALRELGLEVLGSQLDAGRHRRGESRLSDGLLRDGGVRLNTRVFDSSQRV